MTDWRQAIVDNSPWIGWDTISCYWCNAVGSYSSDFIHEEDCIYLAAKKFIEEPHCECCHFGDSLD